jgi:uncharacterized protein YjiS (DUF1127 family)
MLFESQWAGDAIADPICRTYDREDAFFESRDDLPTNLSGWRSWFSSIASIVAQLWSAMLRERELRRMSLAWERVDDRTLKDIGVSRYEIEYGTDARPWS